MSAPIVTAGLNPSEILGPLVVGALLNIWLFSLGLIPFIRFWTSTKSHHIILKLAVGSLCLLDVVSVSASSAAAYSVLITSYGNLLGVVTTGYWLRPIYTVCSALGGCVVQLFLISRIYRLTKNFWTSVPLGFVSVAALSIGMSLADASHSASTTHSYSVRINIWMATSAGIDTTVSAVLLVLLYRVRQQASEFHESRLRAPLTRLMVRTVESGAVTTAVALIALALHVAYPDLTRYYSALLPLGRLYTLTIYFCIFSPSPGVEHSTHSHSHSGGVYTGRPAKSTPQTKRGVSSGDVRPAQHTVSINLQHCDVGALEAQGKAHESGALHGASAETGSA